MIKHMCFPVALALIIAGGPLHADSFKCGKHFIKAGDSKASVILRCGDPVFQEVISGADERKVEQLTYKGKGYRGFIRILTFKGGVLEHIGVGARVD